jgi:HEAT repeat protein
MLRSMLIAAVAAVGFVASANPANDSLESEVTARDGWVAYRVPMIAGVDGPCCYSVRSGTETKKGCDLDQRGLSFSTEHDDRAVGREDTLAVYVKVENSRVERVRAVGASCPVRTANAVRWIDSVNAADSVAMLSSLLDRKAGNSDDHPLMTLAFHADTSATHALETRAEPSHALKEREKALFWLGQTRGADGAEVIKRYATTDSDPKLRGKAVFALSQSRVPQAYAHILNIAHHDPAEQVRGDAYFWLSQMDDARAQGDIIAALKSESSDEVRERAVFALSQLNDGAADEGLICVLRGDYPRSVKKQALFWLGQSGSPQAMAYFDDALE